MFFKLGFYARREKLTRKVSFFVFASRLYDCFYCVFVVFSFVVCLLCCVLCDCICNCVCVCVVVYFV